MTKKSRLAILMEAAASTAGADAQSLGSKGGSVNKIQNIAIDKVYVNPTQHRTYFDPDEQQKLQNAVQQNGFQGAILLRPLPESLSDVANEGCEYELVYGESRIRAVRALDWDTIPSIVKRLNDQEVHRIRLDENLVRKDLNPLEEMNGLLEVAADELGVSAKRVLSLMDEVQNAEKRGKELTSDVASQAEKLQSVLDYYKKGTLLGFRGKYRKLQALPEDIKAAVQKSLDWSKAVEIKPIKNPGDRKKVLKWAVENNPSIKEIRAKRKELASKADSGVVTNSGGDSGLREKFYDAISKVKESEVWENPKQQKRLNKLIADFEKVFGIEVLN